MNFTSIIYMKFNDKSFLYYKKTSCVHIYSASHQSWYYAYMSSKCVIGHFAFLCKFSSPPKARLTWDETTTHFVWSKFHSSPFEILLYIILHSNRIPNKGERTMGCFSLLLEQASPDPLQNFYPVLCILTDRLLTTKFC